MDPTTTRRQECKQFLYESNGDTITVKVLELLDPDFGMYVWPSALVLAEYVFQHLNMVRGTQELPTTVLELGAGTALPSLLLARVLPSTHNFVIVTDRPDVPLILDNVRASLKENGVERLYPSDPKAQVMVRGLGWGDFALASKDNKDGGLLQLLEDVSAIGSGRIDLILGSDVFYNPPDFEPLLATVSYIINRHNPDCVFLTTYQDRSAKRNIDQLLRKWNLEGSIIDQEDFGFEVSKFVVGDAEDGDRNESTTISDSDMDDADDAGDHIAETAQRKYNESIGIDQTYQIGDGGALSSVHLLFICKQGHGDSLKAWKAKIIV